MGRHQSTPAAGTAKKEKKAERRCKQRPPGAEPLKAKASSLIYKRSRGAGSLINKAAQGMLHLCLEALVCALPPFEDNGTCSRPLPRRMGSQLLVIACTGAARGARSLREGSGHSYWEMAGGSKGLEEEGFVCLPLCFVRF